MDPAAPPMAAVRRLSQKPAKSRWPRAGTSTPAAQAAASASGRPRSDPRPRTATAETTQGKRPTTHQQRKKKRTKARRASQITWIASVAGLRWSRGMAGGVLVTDVDYRLKVDGKG
jgi:hypothetical protein